MDKGKHRPLQKKEAALSVQERDDETEIKEEGISGERSLMKRLQKGDETAFIQLVEQYHTSLLRLARRYVSTQSSAEEVVQETWMGVHQRLPFFEGRSSLKTWIVRILINRAHTCALRDRRMIPFSALTKREEEPDVFAVEPEHFQGDGQPFSGGWTSRKGNEQDIPEERLLSLETHTCIAETIEALPASQRAVMVLCDIEGWKPQEICTKLGISTVNQRVLLHRARSKVRRVLEKYFDGE